jgi:hypothetical protein
VGAPGWRVVRSWPRSSCTFGSCTRQCGSSTQTSKGRGSDRQVDRGKVSLTGIERVPRTRQGAPRRIAPDQSATVDRPTVRPRRAPFSQTDKGSPEFLHQEKLMDPGRFRHSAARENGVSVDSSAARSSRRRWAAAVSDHTASCLRLAARIRTIRIMHLAPLKRWNERAHNTHS